MLDDVTKVLICVIRGLLEAEASVLIAGVERKRGFGDKVPRMLDDLDVLHLLALCEC